MKVNPGFQFIDLNKGILVNGKGTQIGENEYKKFFTDKPLVLSNLNITTDDGILFVKTAPLTVTRTDDGIIRFTLDFVDYKHDKYIICYCRTGDDNKSIVAYVKTFLLTALQA